MDVERVLQEHGTTYADEAGITLHDKPAPLFQLLVLAELLSTRINASIAVAAARELFAAGYRTPEKMVAASWQDRVDALGRGHYKRYDESTATRLGDAALLLIDRWGSDLRKLHDDAGDDVEPLQSRLEEFPGIGPAGAAIYLREVQSVWPGLRPFFDPKALDGARSAGLPTSPDELAALVDPSDHARLAAALVRVALS